MTISVALIAPSGIVSTSVTGLSGTAYAVDANGFLTVTQAGDPLLFLNAGYRFASPQLSSQAISANGITATSLRLLDTAASTGGALAAAASAGLFGFAITLGTGFALVTEAANSNAKTDAGLLEYMLPPNYVAGQNLTVTINTTIAIGSGALSVKTIGLAAYRTAKDGTQGGNICATSTITIPANAATDNVFTITGTSLLPGDRLVLQPTLALTETSGHNVTATVNSIRVS